MCKDKDSLMTVLVPSQKFVWGMIIVNSFFLFFFGGGGRLFQIGFCVIRFIWKIGHPLCVHNLLVYIKREQTCDHNFSSSSHRTPWKGLGHSFDTASFSIVKMEAYPTGYAIWSSLWTACRRCDKIIDRYFWQQYLLTYPRRKKTILHI